VNALIKVKRLLLAQHAQYASMYMYEILHVCMPMRVCCQDYVMCLKLLLYTFHRLLQVATDHFSSPGKAVGMCVRIITFEINDP